MTLSATNDEAIAIIAGPYDTLAERLEAAGVRINWTGAWPLVDASGEIVGVTDADDPEPTVLVERTKTGWITYDGAVDAAMRPWAAEDLGLVTPKEDED